MLVIEYRFYKGTKLTAITTWQVSNKIDETHSEVSKSLSLPYDAVTDGLNSLALKARSYSAHGMHAGRMQ